MHLHYFHRLLILMLLLPGCSLYGSRVEINNDAYVQANDRLQECLSLYTSLDNYLFDHGFADVQDFRIPGYTFLRVNRFLSSFRNELTDVPMSIFWLDQLARLDWEARALEISKVRPEDINKLSTHVKSKDSLFTAVEQCSESLVSRISSNTNIIADIRSRAIVPDNYNTLMRTLGLYPFSSLFVSLGIKEWHKKTIASFRKAEKHPAQEENYIAYQPDIKPVEFNLDLPDIFMATANNPLSIPIPENDALQVLLDRYAPVWKIETLNDADRFGIPVISDTGNVTIDTSNPAVYYYISYTRFDNRVLLQLNFTIWFPERPVTGWYDLLGGHLDGITWRVTLDKTGLPLFYDVIHNCGCYHMIFPSTGIRKKESLQFLEEPILVPATAPEFKADDRIVISVESGTHYIKNIQNEHLETTVRKYKFSDYNNLRNLPVGSGLYRSIFDQQGLVPGTERKERWILWPMGIIEPGAMRQRGQHATAFVGKRHFDDPFLFQENFSRTTD